MIKTGQIWVRRPDPNYLPDDSWKVQIVEVSRNGVVYRAIEYNGEKVDGVQISVTPSAFREKYYLERRER